jgi:UDP-2,3-diacylglucosamine pyrophosphatase LpxH
MAIYRTAWISDIHLGTRGSQAGAVLEFLRDNEFDTLYLVGDIIDIWALRRGIYWPQEHNDVVQKLLRKARKGSTVIYIPGNHDEFVTHFLGQFGAITLKKNDIHTCVNGKRILIMHGHELDTVVQNLGWLAHIGDIGYKILLELNSAINFIRRLSGREYWSLSAYVKNEVKNVVSFIGDFENAVVRYAKDYQVDGVLCGHIHHAAIRTIQDKIYYNSGDWVESCTALVENHDGSIELLNYSSALGKTSDRMEDEEESILVSVA